MLPQALRIEARIDLKTFPGTGKLTGLYRVVGCQTRLVPIDAHCRDDAQAEQLMMCDAWGGRVYHGLPSGSQIWLAGKRLIHEGI